MTATSHRPRRPRARIRPPPPTPIRRARGARSAGVDDPLLADYLASSRTVPELTLPNRRRFDFNFPAPVHLSPAMTEDVPGTAVAAGEEAASRWVLAAAAESGAFRIGGVVGVEEVGAAIEAARMVFERRQGDLGRWFKRRDLIGEELYWYRPVSKEMDRVFETALPDSASYRVFRETMETLASKMESIAESVIKILSENAKNSKLSVLSRGAPSVLCMTQYNCNQLKAHWNEFGSTDAPNSYAMSLHLSGRDQEYCLRCPQGSTFFKMPAGSVLVTIGKQIQEWSDGVFKSAIGEILFELTDDPNPFISLELLYSPGDVHPTTEVDLQPREVDLYNKIVADTQNIVSLHDHPKVVADNVKIISLHDHPKVVADTEKIISLHDQLLMALVALVFFYRFLAWIC